MKHVNDVKAGYSLADMDMSACMGLQAIMHTIMMGKMEMVLPDMYMIKRFIGICFRGPRATSQQRCKTKEGRGGVLLLLSSTFCISSRNSRINFSSSATKAD